MSRQDCLMRHAKKKVLQCIALFSVLYIVGLYLLMLLYRVGGGRQPVNHVNAFALGISATYVGAWFARKQGHLFSRQEYIGVVIGSFIIDSAFQILVIYQLRGLSFVFRSWCAISFVGAAHLVILATCYSAKMVSRLLPKGM